MQSDFRITSSAVIRHGKVVKDEVVLFEKPDVSYQDFIGSAYSALQVNYPKFFKMDALSKLGFIAAEVLLRGRTLKEEAGSEKAGIILSNANASLDADINYLNASQMAPSPALFVYTLPNIVIGEICIRHGLKGENTFFVSEKFDTAFQTRYVNDLLADRRLDACINGRCELLGEQYEALFCLVEHSENGYLHAPETLEQLYTKWNN